MAYAAADSISFAIYSLLESPRISVASHIRESLKSAYDQAQSLQTTLCYCSGVVLPASDEEQVIKEARVLEDAIEYAVSAQFLEQSRCCKPIFSTNLDHLKQTIDRFTRKAKKMKGRVEELWEQKAAKIIEEQIVEICLPPKAKPEQVEENDLSASAAEMVGLRDVFEKFRDALAEPPLPHRKAELDYLVLWITGMAGVGKTAIAKRLYHDPSVKSNFECRAFVRVGQEYWFERILQTITAQLNRGNANDGDNQDVYERFRTTLQAKRCLIVLDDVWDDEVFTRIFNYPLERCGSRVLLTSRIRPQQPFVYCGREMRFLDEEESWELLKLKVFGNESCPPLLVKPGKKIAKRCEGLPLLIIAVADVLSSKVEKNPESWKRVAKKPYSVLEEASNQISEVLLSSYSYLNEIFKYQFLYIAAFPQSCAVHAYTINNLWHAEGLYHFIISQDCDNYEAEVFRALIHHHLIISDGNLGVSLHCAYWFLCKKIAKDNKFLYIMNSYADGMDGCVESHRRLAIQTNVLLAINEVRENIMSVSNVRSLLCTGPYHQYQVPIGFEWRLLRILDALSIRFYEFPVEVVQLILLKYLALTCNGDLSPSISKLWKLEYLIVHQHLIIRRVGSESYVPVEVWDLQELIHLEITGRNLPEPPHPGVVLPNLTQLFDVRVESCTKGVLENIPKLKKLRVQIEMTPDAAEISMCFDHISGMDNLESFETTVINPALLSPAQPLSIPTVSGIEDLSLSGFGYPWEEMRQIAKLPKLESLKLRSYAFRGEKWEDTGLFGETWEEIRLWRERWDEMKSWVEKWKEVGLFGERREEIRWLCEIWEEMRFWVEKWEEDKEMRFQGEEIKLWREKWEEMASWVELWKEDEEMRFWVQRWDMIRYRGEEWEENEEMKMWGRRWDEIKYWRREKRGFRRLRRLYIEDTDVAQWRMPEESMPYLENLTIKNCHKLREIPTLSVRDIEIELIDCNPLAEACTLQRYSATGRASVTVTHSWNEKNPTNHHNFQRFSEGVVLSKAPAFVEE